MNTPSHSPAGFRPVVTFLNHGILPLVGREREIATILEFWRATTAEPAPAALLVSAEAGMGKSRLADEIVLRIERLSGAAVHLRFYPDSSLSLAPLLSAALRLTVARQQLLTGRSEPPGTIALLRRLTHLRPTILILEDIHLLAGNPLRELQEMLQATRDFPLAILFLTRPIELPTRGVIEPWLVGELQLEGVTRGDVDRLMAEIFGLSGVEWLPDALYHATLGNPLAIRSALRAAVTSGAMELLPDGAWRVTLDRDQFERSLHRGVHLLTEGMVAHLTPSEREGAERLAELGEVFAPETARAIIDDADDLVRTLLFRGILSPLELPIAPLVGTTGRGQTLAFSHTLLHRNLLGALSLSRERVIAAVAADLPFFSIGILDRLGESLEALPDPRIVQKGIELIDFAMHRIDGTTDWKLGPRLLQTTDALVDAHRSVWDPLTTRRIELKLLHRHVTALRREDTGDRFREALDRFLQATEGELPHDLREYRIAALKQEHGYRMRQGEMTAEQSWNEIEQLIAGDEDLRYTLFYIVYLRYVIDRATIESNIPLTHVVERRFAEMEATGRLDPALGRPARWEILSKLLCIVESAEELERRLAFLAEMEAGPDRNNNRFVYRKIMLLRLIGRIVELLPILDEWTPRFQSLDLVRNAAQCSIMAAYEPAAFGEDLQEIAVKVKHLIETASEITVTGFRSSAAVNMPSKAMLRGEQRMARQFARDFDFERKVMEYELRLLLALSAEEQEAEKELEVLVSEESLHYRELSLGRASYMLASVLVDGADSSSLARAIDMAREELRMPIVRLRDLHRTQAILTLIERLRDRGEERVEKELLPDIGEALRLAMTWLEERGLNGYMLPLVTLYRRWWTRRQAESWQARIQQIVMQRKARAQGSTEGETLRIRMLGAIEAGRPDGEIVQIRGGRLRTMLGLLVADRMLSRPLGHREFCRIASGEEDPDRARKTMNGAVMRLREALGENIIDTTGETPRLDLSLASVDLLDAFELCGRGAEAMRNGMLAGAIPRVREALDIWNGDVPFPALYESFFEAAREDFENRISSTTLAVARALLAEDDPAGAEEILRRAAPMLPGDEAMAALLIEALERSGRKADAERERRRV